MPLSSYYMHKLLCKASFVVLFCGFVVGARAELTQAEITAAINAAVLRTVPYSASSYRVTLASYLMGGNPAKSVGVLASEINDKLSQIVANSVGSGGSAWTTNDVVALRETLASLNEAITGFYYPDINAAVWDIHSLLNYWEDVVFRGWSEEFFDVVHFTGDSELLVHDPSTENAISSMQGALIDKIDNLLQNMTDNNAAVVSAIQNQPTVDLTTLESNTDVLRSQAEVEQEADDNVK